MSYKVTDTQKIQSITAAGSPTAFYRVWLTTDHGSSGYIDISPEDWQREKLSQLLDKFAAELDLAFSLER